MDCDTAVGDLQTVGCFLSRARVIFAPKLDDCDIRAEIRLEAGGGYGPITPKNIKEVVFSGEIGHNVGPGGEMWSAPNGEVIMTCLQIEGRRRMDAGDRLSVHDGQSFLSWKWTKGKYKSGVTHYRIPHTTFKRVEKNPRCSLIHLADLGMRGNTSLKGLDNALVTHIPYGTA